MLQNHYKHDKAVPVIPCSNMVASSATALPSATCFSANTLVFMYEKMLSHNKMKLPQSVIVMIFLNETVFPLSVIPCILIS